MQEAEAAKKKCTGTWSLKRGMEISLSQQVASAVALEQADTKSKS